MRLKGFQIAFLVFGVFLVLLVLFGIGMISGNLMIAPS